MAQISGNARKFNGDPVDYLVLFDWATGEHVETVTPETNGAWTFDPPNDGQYGITYVAEGCQPETHGPYELEGLGLPTVIGEFFQGGYYIGDIEDQGQMYKVLVAPIEADVYGLQWKTSRTTTGGTDSLTDGWSNTWSMNIGDHPAASHCLDYRGGGHDDWYMPAKNELNLFWLNIAPGKTQVPEFRSGGEQALHGSQHYWASTQGASNAAWAQRFIDGGQGKYVKDDTFRRVRPVRRLPFTP